MQNLSRQSTTHSPSWLTPAASLTLRYLMFGMLWILFSDSVLSWVAPESQIWQMSHIHILKGIFFIGVTAAVLFYFIQRIDQRILDRERDISTLFSLNPQPMLMIDPHTLEIVDVNRSVQILLEKDRFDLIGSCFPTLFHDQHSYRLHTELCNAKFGYAFQKLGPWSLDVKPGMTCTFTLNVARIENSGSDLIMILLTDITAQLKAEKQAKDLSHFLEQKVVERTTYLERLNDDLVFRARETEKVNAELIFINERLQTMARETNNAELKPISFSASQTKARNPGASE